MRAILTVSIAVISAGIGASVPVQTPRPDIDGHATMRFSAQSGTSLGEPVILRATLTNTGQDEIVVDFGGNSTTEFRISHTRPDGSVQVVRPGLPFPRGTSVLIFFGEYRLERKQTHTVFLVLDEWLTLTQEGKHQLGIEFLGPLKDKDGRALSVDRQAAFSITVGPRDPKRLREQCQDWLETGLSAKTADERLASLAALSLVQDPVGIPFLETGAARDMCAGCTVALARIGNADAIAALRRLAQSPNGNVGAKAKSVLATIKRP